MDRKEFLLIKIMARQRARAIIEQFNQGMQPVQQQQQPQPAPTPEIQQQAQANMTEGENGAQPVPSPVR